MKTFIWSAAYASLIFLSGYGVGLFVSDTNSINKTVRNYESHHQAGYNDGYFDGVKFGLASQSTDWDLIMVGTNKIVRQIETPTLSEFDRNLNKAVKNWFEEGFRSGMVFQYYYAATNLDYRHYMNNSFSNRFKEHVKEDYRE